MAGPLFFHNKIGEFNKLKPSSSEKGRFAEDKAMAFLKIQGLVLITRNYHSPHGEIDLIMQDRDTTVFIEVRSRKNDSFLQVIETIDQHKKNKIILTSEHYLQNAEKFKSKYYRFDIVAIKGPENRMNIEWIKNAFDA